MNWRAIIISTILAAFIGVALMLLLPSDTLNGILTLVGFSCPPAPPGSGIGGAIGAGLACGIGAAITLILLYFIFALIVSLILVWVQVQQQRFLHTVVTVILSLPVAFIVLAGISQLTS
ncbi:MAG: hypothetical protein K8L99_09545 [Anaerolineae bacterium]|nr:hypothetical protein [Anaerolineae bacterium]